METKIYYFTGTGNSMSIANKLSARLGDVETISITHIINNEEDIEGEIIGIVCPIYMYNIPYMVADFIKKIKSVKFSFVVFAGAGKLGTGDKAARKAFKQNNLKLSAVFNVPMPSNYSNFGATPVERRREMFNNVDNKIEDIVNIIYRRKEFTDDRDTGFFKTYIHPGLLYKMGYARINVLDNSFTSDKNCNGCAICEKVCPVDNIEMKDSKPAWQNKCQQCYACLQWCPKQSIQSGKTTIGVERYHHPDVKLKDIISASSLPQ